MPFSLFWIELAIIIVSKSKKALFNHNKTKKVTFLYGLGNTFVDLTTFPMLRTIAIASNDVK